jgi:hypothetical protein
MATISDMQVMFEWVLHCPYLPKTISLLVFDIPSTLKMQLFFPDLFMLRRLNDFDGVLIYGQIMLHVDRTYSVNRLYAANL